MDKAITERLDNSKRGTEHCAIKVVERTKVFSGALQVPFTRLHVIQSIGEICGVCFDHLDTILLVIYHLFKATGTQIYLYRVTAFVWTNFADHSFTPLLSFENGLSLSATFHTHQPSFAK